MKKILALLLTVCVGVAALSLTACNKTTPVIGLICLQGESSAYDKNYIDAFKQACENKGLGEGEYVIATNVPEGDESYEKAVQFVNMGCKAVFANGFKHEQYMLKVAREYADVTICHATGTMAHTEKQKNFHNAFASIYEGRYLAGVAGGMKLKEMYDNGTIGTKNFVIGYVGTFNNAEVISGYTAFYLGVKSVTDTIKGSTLTMKVKYSLTWYDEEAERNIATALINEEGCMLISQHTYSMGVPTACETAGVPNVSFNRNTAEECPDTFIVSSKIDWTSYFEMMIDKALGKGELPVDYVGTMQSGAVVLSELGQSAAQGTDEAIKEAKAKMIDGTLKVFDCAKFTINGEVLSDNYQADVDTDSAFTPDTNVIKVVGDNLEYFSESDPEYRSAPYFTEVIDGIVELNKPQE